MFTIVLSVLWLSLNIASASSHTNIPQWCKLADEVGIEESPDGLTCFVSQSQTPHVADGSVIEMSTIGPGANLATLDIKPGFKPEGKQEYSELSLKVDLGMPLTGALIQLPQFSTASAVTLNNVNLLVNNCNAWTDLGNQICSQDAVWQSQVSAHGQDTVACSLYDKFLLHAGYRRRHQQHTHCHQESVHKLDQRFQPGCHSEECQYLVRERPPKASSLHHAQCEPG